MKLAEKFRVDTDQWLDWRERIKLHTDQLTFCCDMALCWYNPHRQIEWYVQAHRLVWQNLESPESKQALHHYRQREIAHAYRRH